MSGGADKAAAFAALRASHPVPGIYRHYKGALVALLTVARDDADPDRWLVVYASVKDGAVSGTPWVMSLNRWQDMMSDDGATYPRYEFVSPSLEGV